MQSVTEPIGSGPATSPPSLEVSHVPPELVPEVWFRLRPMIERGLAHGAGDTTTAEHMFASIIRGDMQLWAVHEGSEIIAGLVVSVRKTSVKTWVHIELAAGRDLDRWADRLEGLLRDFRDLTGADTIEASCRLGLAHRLKKRGWRRKAVLMELK